MKKSKTVKNQNPKLFGYGSIEQLLADSTRFGDNPKDPLNHWVAIRDADGDLRFIPCTEEYFHFHRNEQRNERRRRDVESRCMIPSEKFGLVKCRDDCNNCQRERNGNPVSIDYMFEEYNFEYSSEDYEEELEKRRKQEHEDQLWSHVNEFDESDQMILKLYNEGKTDSAIATILKKSRSMVQERRTKLIDMLKENMKKYGN